MYQLGLCYWYGYGVNKNVEKAYYWLKKASEFNLVEANVYYYLAKLKLVNKPYLNEIDTKKLKTIKNKMRQRIIIKPSYHAKFLRLHLFPVRNDYRYDHYSLNEKMRCLKDFSIFKLFLWKISKGEVINKINYFKEELKRLNSPYKSDKLKLSKNDNEQTLYPESLRLPASCFLQGQILVWEWLNSSRSDNKLIIKAKEKFKQGVLLNNDLNCELELMHCDVRLNELTLEKFSKSTDIKFAEYPLYWLLKFSVKNPEYLGINEFLNGQYSEAEKLWKKQPLTLKNKYLLFLFTLYNYQPSQLYLMTDVNQLQNNNSKRIDKAENYYKKLAKKNISEVEYIRAVMILNKQYNTKNSPDLTRSALSSLRNLANNNNLLAKFQLIKNAYKESTFSKGIVTKDMLKDLQELCKLKYPPAWLLASDLYAKINTRNLNKNKTRKIISFYKRAAQLGELEALNRIAVIYYKIGGKRNLEKASQYWRKFLAEDNKRKSFDLSDPYSQRVKKIKDMELYVIGDIKDSKLNIEMVSFAKNKMLLDYTFIRREPLKGFLLRGLMAHYNILDKLYINSNIFPVGKGLEERKIKANSKRGIKLIKLFLKKYDVAPLDYLDQDNN